MLYKLIVPCKGKKNNRKLQIFSTKLLVVSEIISNAIFVQQNRQDLADGELAQGAVIDAYLPKPLTCNYVICKTVIT